MSSAEELADDSREPEGFDFKHYVRTEARSYGSGGKIRLVANFDAKAAEHLREMPISEDQAMRDLEGGLVEVSATVEDDELLMWWLLGFGRWVRVKSPVPVKAAIMDEINAALTNYNTRES